MREQEGSTVADGVRIRRGVHNLTAEDVTAFRQSYREMMAIRDNRSYAFFAGLHGAPNFWCWHHQRSERSGQLRQLFLPWHRAYLYNFELAMRDRVSGVSLPWWDWTLRPPRQNGIPRIFTDRMANGQPNPLASFRMDVPNASPPLRRATVRRPGPLAALPTQQAVDRVLTNNTDWSSFTDALEQIHDQIHGWVSGDMGFVATAAYDPIFWSHHAMIDRLWWLWQVRNGNGVIPPDLLDVVLAPFTLRVSDVLSPNALGYDYGAAQTIVEIGGT
jgi:tyrosinase